MAEVFNLTPEQIDALTPRDIFRGLVRVAIIGQDEKMLHALARDWGPYEHPRKSETVTLTPEELRRVAAAAKSEAGRRGLVIDLAGRRAVGTV